MDPHHRGSVGKLDHSLCALFHYTEREREREREKERERERERARERERLTFCQCLLNVHYENRDILTIN